MELTAIFAQRWACRRYVLCYMMKIVCMLQTLNGGECDPSHILKMFKCFEFYVFCVEICYFHIIVNLEFCVIFIIYLLTQMLHIYSLL